MAQTHELVGISLSDRASRYGEHSQDPQGSQEHEP